MDLSMKKEAVVEAVEAVAVEAVPVEAVAEVQPEAAFKPFRPFELTYPVHNYGFYYQELYHIAKQIEMAGRINQCYQAELPREPVPLPLPEPGETRVII